MIVHYKLNKVEKFQDILTREQSYFVSKETLKIPPGIALNRAFKENLFMILVGLATKTPTIGMLSNSLFLLTQINTFCLSKIKWWGNLEVRKLLQCKHYKIIYQWHKKMKILLILALQTIG